MNENKKAEKHFCNCPSDSCPNHPSYHNMGCDPCIKKNLAEGEIPACFWLLISDNFDGITEYTIESFVQFYLNNKGESTA